ncbi:heavy-metal-associated domain-containing protein [Rhodocytophaga aerolata]|uniref:Heavy-metal-associated domain-containing protein n=1 Tax=Rhodocytophaga aerolata TaxID=455078 RepID=A0ABT8RAU7_9BACT|nr:heavy-metal-associated domain-containing protein [Rhodocytophaga aerolata]MDO1449219.1 heavy-metal-associated domain-containing protein [Rhodocytophaga aerolata]
MNTLKFKTNIKCAGCVAKVTPHLNQVEGIEGNWQIDFYNPNKLLTVETDKVSTSQIKEAVQKAGFTIEQV